MYISLFTFLTLLTPSLSSPFQPPTSFQSPMSPSSPTIYFAYGSNLWLHQMHLRCPSSTYIGLARLSGFKWLINTRGYANIVETPHPTTSEGAKDEDEDGDEDEDEVWGMLYTLTPADEAQLDKNEGVPEAYTKELVRCEFWSAEETRGKIDVGRPMTDTRHVLVYIDRRRTTAGVPRAEYVYRMNRGIEDAVECGVPGGYVEGVVREFIPEDEVEGVEEFAKGQARGFRDESGVIKE
ncbi:gamma-glutamylcyclotransferase [Parastagonospora nodorum]|nr:gamma-glutamylcyclotransferase [Parastagonospora nodorum]KAH5095852.1 gamma-glutamylcyclotransferase [Parastagonospora nodorum]